MRLTTWMRSKGKYFVLGLGFAVGLSVGLVFGKVIAIGLLIALTPFIVWIHGKNKRKRV